MNVGSDVLIWGGVSDLQHGRITAIHTEFEHPFAMVNLRRKDGKLGKSETLVPLNRCFTLPDYVIKMQEKDRAEWLKKYRPNSLDTE